MIASVVLCACGGGNAATATIASATPIATATPTQSSQIVSVGAVPAPFELSTIASGVGVSGQFRQVTSGSSNANISLTWSQPSLTTRLQGAPRQPQAIGTTNISPIAFVVVYQSVTVSFAAYPQFTFTIPSGQNLPAGTYTDTLTVTLTP